MGKNPHGWVNQVVDEFGSLVDSRLLRDLQDATKLAGVKRLYLGYSALADEHIERLSHATDLQYLFLAKTGVADQALRHLKTLANLRDHPLLTPGHQVLKEDPPRTHHPVGDD